MPECFGDGEEIKLGAYAVTEPQAGSDVKSLKTTAKRDGDEWVLNGTKVFITNGGIADVHVVVATVDPELGTRGQASFVVGKDTPGLCQGKKETKLGIRASHTAEVVLEDCRIPVENLLGGEEKLEKKLRARPLRPEIARSADALATFEVTRPIVGASALGIAQAAYEWTLEYLDGRSEGGVPLLQTQRVQQTLADVATEIEAARLLVQRASWMGRNGVPMTGGQGSMSKLKAGDVTMWATTTLMDLVGPDAWNTECPLEKWFRDAKIYQLFEGTAEIQRMVISPHAGARVRRAPRLRRRGRRRGDGEPKEPVPRRPEPSWVPLSGRFAGVPATDPDGSGSLVHGLTAHSHALDARREDSRRRMWIALAINVGLLLAEAVGGILTGSLAVLADAGHLLSDVGSIVLALIAARLASLPAAGRRTFGYQRSEVLAALVNGLLLVAVSVGDRDRRRSAASPTRRRSTAPASSRSASSASPATSPRPASSPAASARTSTSRACCATASPTRSARSASSLAGAFVLAGGSDIVDPIVGLLIAALVLASSWRLIKEPVRRADGGGARPTSTSTAMGAAICEEEGVRSVHDLHVWTVTAGFGAVAAHVVVAHGCRPRPDPPPARADAARAVRDRAHDPADGGGGRRGPAAGRERARRSALSASPVAGTVCRLEAGFRRLASLGSMLQNRLVAVALSVAAAALCALLLAGPAAPAAGPPVQARSQAVEAGRSRENARAC